MRGRYPLANYLAPKPPIQNVVMARMRRREGTLGPWHIMSDWNTALCGKTNPADWKRVSRFSHVNRGHVCTTCWHAMKNHREQIAAMIVEWDNMKKEKAKDRSGMYEAHCILCRPQKNRTALLDKNGIPLSEKGWRFVMYTDGDIFYYCPDHSPEQVLQAILDRCDHEISLYCGIERVYGFGEIRRCAHLDLYFVALDDQDTIAQAMPMSLEGANKLREWKLKDYPEARIMPCTLICNFCEYGYPK